MSDNDTTPRTRDALNIVEAAWALIAAVDGGSWVGQTDDWRAQAELFRMHYRDFRHDYDEVRAKW